MQWLSSSMCAAISTAFLFCIVQDAATAEAEVPAAAEADSNGAQEQLLSPLDRARQALEGDNLDKSLMVSRNNQYQGVILMWHEKGTGRNGHVDCCMEVTMAHLRSRQQQRGTGHNCR
eukprot:GHRQ01009885.1.p3 GENE.GHRQ01009885.1~~GHRQ01009885.1.p3  ORF type:complete len:118 (+),score=33.51 GHRQ01009885.1:486-839(+)